MPCILTDQGKQFKLHDPQYHCLPILIFSDHPSSIVFMISLVFHCAIHNPPPGFSVSLFVHHSGSMEVSHQCILFFVIRYCTFATACTLLWKSTLENSVIRYFDVHIILTIHCLAPDNLNSSVAVRFQLSEQYQRTR